MPERSETVSSTIFRPAYRYETVRSDRCFETRLPRGSYAYSATRRSGCVISVTVGPGSAVQDDVAPDWVSEPVQLPVQEPGPMVPPGFGGCGFPVPSQIHHVNQDTHPLPLKLHDPSSFPLPDSEVHEPDSTVPEEVSPLQDSEPVPVGASVQEDVPDSGTGSDWGVSVQEEVPGSAGGGSVAGGGSAGGTPSPEPVSEPSQISFRSDPVPTGTARAFSVTRTSRSFQS